MVGSGGAIHTHHHHHSCHVPQVASLIRRGRHDDDESKGASSSSSQAHPLQRRQSLGTHVLVDGFHRGIVVAQFARQFAVAESSPFAVVAPRGIDHHACPAHIGGRTRVAISVDQGGPASAVAGVRGRPHGHQRVGVATAAASQCPWMLDLIIHSWRFDSIRFLRPGLA